MLSQELLTGVNTIIEAHESDLSGKIGIAIQTREELADAKIAVSEAEAAVKVANQNLTQAQKQVRTLETAEQRSESTIESAAKEVAVDIANDTTIEPLPRTLYSLIYSDRSLAWQETPDAFKVAAERGRVAVSALMERLQLGEPVLLFSRSTIIADKAKEDTLVATPPTTEVKLGNYTSLNGGSIDVVLPDAYSAEATDQELVRVNQKPADVTLMSSYYEYDVDRLEVAASNEQWLVVGNEAITAKLKQLDPVKRLVALTALKAAEVEVPVELEDEIKENTANRLVSLIAFLAAGTGQETTTRSVVGRDSWTGGSYHTQVTKDTPLTAMAKSVDKQSIKYTAQAIGLTKEALRERVEVVLKSRVGSDSTALDQLAKDLQSLTNVDQILDAIF